ncbi:hypothetical protein Mgra_00008766 [Meloidogyne graminicola]|uniref:Uncharacterized protein n=1 Tax=Meloidogyne graminicola TaxID=189291 RepID=A0A8S9ZES7_9BILA|nr:hypothetical protein Mgra_00008766 [Meloidogyne graminicola]
MASQKVICFLTIISFLFLIGFEYINAETCQECFNNLCNGPCASSCSACSGCQNDFKRLCRTPCSGFKGTLVIPPCT